MGRKGSHWRARRMLRAVAALAAMAATAGLLAAGSAHPVSSHHNLADNGVISSRN